MWLLLFIISAPFLLLLQCIFTVMCVAREETRNKIVTLAAYLCSSSLACVQSLTIKVERISTAVLVRGVRNLGSMSLSFC